MPVDQGNLLALRTAGERARMQDLQSLLAHSLASPDDDQRRTALSNRIDDRDKWAADLHGRPDAWEEWHSQARSADTLVDEIVALLMTRLLRSEGLDGGAFDSAEALIHELTQAAGVKPLVLAHTQEMESIDHTRSTVSLRFPGSRIWDVPFLGHEFGHHAVEQVHHLEPALSDRRPLQEIADATAQTLSAAGETADRSRKHADELMADVLATISCGPTYPVACLVLRVPGDAQASRASSSHPSWRDRVAVMRETLDALTDITGHARYQQQRETVVDPLACQVVGSHPAVAAAGELASRQAVKAVLKHRPDLVYRDADRAIQVSGQLSSKAERRLPEGASVRAIVDGAWRWRLSHPGDEETTIAGIATGWCRTVHAARGAPR